MAKLSEQKKVELLETAVANNDVDAVNCPNVTIYAPTGSYAETWANKHNIPFVAE